MCQRLTRTTPGPAPLLTDFVPCCTAVSILDSSQCLCDPDVLTGGVALTPGCQICSGLNRVLTHNNNVVKNAGGCHQMVS